MALIKSISGIRGTIGGQPGMALTHLDVVKFTAAFGSWLGQPEKRLVIVGRDARLSGKMINDLVITTLIGMGFDVLDIGLATTPTVEIAVTTEAAAGGIILTASHNPGNWNALKLLNSRGECIGAKDGDQIIKLAEKEQMTFVPIEKVGTYLFDEGTHLRDHIDLILQHPLVDVKAIKKARLVVAVDAVNSVGGVAVPKLLKKLRVWETVEINCEPTGIFAHNPEPLPENLSELSKTVVKNVCDVGIAVDPDVDRLALIMENGQPFGEEYTLVAVADYVLSMKKGNTVSNLSSTQALRDITLAHGGKYAASAVGEVNVVALMKKTNAVIGGEGNGGIILPDFHYGRDALMGIALFLSYLARKKCSMTALKATYPEYVISKNKWTISAKTNPEKMLQAVLKKFKKEKVNNTDGVKITFEKDKEWVHLRKSNTEPIIRVYAESQDEKSANKLAKQVMNL